MPDQVTNYKCPACTGPLHYSAETGELVCDYCGSSYDTKEIEAAAAEKERQARENFDDDANRQTAEESGSQWGEDADSVRAYGCPSCGAQLILDASTAATSCPYCGNPTVVPGQLGGALKPDYVLPFKLEKDAAKQALRAHCRRRPLLPKAFTTHSHLEELKGVYVPFWLYDTTADADVAYAATRSMSHRSGDYIITDTDHFRIRRVGTVDFKAVPVDGSSKMPDDYMDSIEPFDYSAMQSFSTAYLPGYMADRYDMTADESCERADTRCVNSAVQEMRDSVHGYETVTVTGQRVGLRRNSVKYALLPVWLLTTSWQGKNWLYAMNGQTGKMVGDLPVDKGRAALWFLGLTVGLTALLTLLAGEHLGLFLMDILGVI